MAALALAAGATCRGRRAPSPSPAAGGHASPELRTRVPLSGPWRFHASQDLAGAEAPGFDDSRWDGVQVPHTWGAQPFKAAWYRLRARLGPRERGRRVYLVFEGVAVYADVFVNGRHLGQHRGAFTRFVFDATDALTGGEDVIAVRADNDLASTADSPAPRRSWPCVTTCSPFSRPFAMIALSPSVRSTVTLRTSVVISGLTTKTYWPLGPVCTDLDGTTRASF